MIRTLLLAVLLAWPAAAEETPELFPAGPHRDETFYLCVACHGAALITRQGMDRDRWDATLTWMSEKHAMPVLEGEDRRQVLDYLAAAFPAEAAGLGDGVRRSLRNEGLNQPWLAAIFAA